MSFHRSKFQFVVETSRRRQNAGTHVRQPIVPIWIHQKIEFVHCIVLQTNVIASISIDEMNVGFAFLKKNATKNVSYSNQSDVMPKMKN